MACKACPEGKSTVTPGATHDTSCVGWAAKYLNPSYCNSSSAGIGVSIPSQELTSSAYLIDEGMPATTDVEFNRKAGNVLRDRLQREGVTPR